MKIFVLTVITLLSLGLSCCGTSAEERDAMHKEAQATLDSIQDAVDRYTDSVKTAK